MKICTSIKQSKKLIELGIDVKTADMWYQHIGYSIIDGKEKPTYFPMVIRDNISDDDIPAWSLTALLDILAKRTHNIDEDGYIVLSSYKGDWWNISPINCISEEIKESNNPLDAAFEMVCWLKENGKL